MPTTGGVTNILKQNIGPLPVWAWGLVAVGAFWAFHAVGGGSTGFPLSSDSSRPPRHSRPVKVPRERHKKINQLGGF
jgi:hypothetical protein